MTRQILICVISLQLAGCTVTIGQQRIVTDTYCTSYQPIRASRHDTELTQAQVKENNRVYDGLCK